MVETAAALRRCARQVIPPYSTKRIIEACFPRIVVAGARLPIGVDEVVQPRSDGHIIVYARTLSVPEQRIAICHGLAHLIFDDDAAGLRPGCSGVRESEERADKFAIELLAPLAELQTIVRRIPSRDPDEHEIYLDHVDEIASRFSVPAAVIDSRIREFVLI